MTSSFQRCVMELSVEIEKLIDVAIAEDIRSGDITTEALLSDTVQISARLFLRQAGVVAGFEILKRIFQKIDPEIEVTLLCQEGIFLKSGTLIASISGRARSILTGERLALNFIQHTSAIATMTAAYVKKVAGLKCVIMDTRKTIPGLRALEKYAVRIGGGKNHRFGLDDRLVIKTNHLAFLPQPLTHAIKDALKKIEAMGTRLPVEIEVNDLSLVDQVVHANVEAIMLRNMTPEDILRAVKKIRRTNKKIYVESSGAITLDTVRAYAETGVDGIAIGHLMYPPQALDMALRLG